MKRSKLLIPAALAVVAIVAAGCSSSPSPGAPAGPSNSTDTSATPPVSGPTSANATGLPAYDGPAVTLTFWGTYGNGGNKAQTGALSKTILPAFEKLYPKITVKYVDIPYNSLLQKLETSAAGGELPDVIRSDIIWVPKFASLGVFAQLDGKMPGFQTLADNDYPGPVATNKWKGHYYGLPLDTNTRLLVSKSQTLASAGITSPPATFAQLKADAPKLKAKGVSVYADSGLQGWNILPWIWSGGGEIANPGLTKATGYLNSATNVKTIQMLVDLYKAGEIPDLLIGSKGATPTTDGLPKGKYATMLGGPFLQPIWTAQYPKFKPTYSPMPSGPGGSISVVGGEDIVMTATSKHKQAAEIFMAFTQTAAYQIPMAKTGQMSVVKSLASKEAAVLPYVAPYITQLKTAKPRPPVPEEPKIDTVLQDDLTPAFEGTTTVKAALDKAAKAIDPLLTATK